MKNIYYLLSFVSIYFVIQANTWVNPTNKRLLTIYYQGMNCSQTQGSKYTGQHGFISPTTGEHVVCKNGIDVIENIWVKPEIDEVVPAPIHRNWKSILLKPRQLALNLWQLSHESVSRLAHKLYGIQVQHMQDTKSAQTLTGHSLIVSKINIAQEGDLANHAARMASFYKENPDSDAILMGASRGAATTFQAAASYNKENKEYLKAVKLIVLEGCFDSVLHAGAIRYPWLFKYEAVLNKVEQGLRKIISFKKDGPSPIKEVQNYPKDIPVVFITSKIDAEVPIQCTKNLVKELIKAGHENVYLLELEKSRHPRYALDNDIDKTKYQNFMHALYERLNLSHIPKYAQAGKDLVDAAKEKAQSLK